MPNSGFLMSIAVISVVAAILWGRSAVFRARFVRRLDERGEDPEARLLATGRLTRDLHAVGVYLVIALTCALAAITQSAHSVYALTLLLIPVGSSIWLARNARKEARVSWLRLDLEERAQQVIGQEESAPQRWAERLAPPEFPAIDGFEMGSAHQAGDGVISGDLLDVMSLPSGRLAAVVGDVTGHGVEASITALQVKYLLRSYLRRYRDPGQALEELNSQLIDLERPEEFVSLFVAVFDSAAGTVRYASAGHPAGWVCVERNPKALPSTGPLLMIDPDATFLSVERPFLDGDMFLVSTDGLVESRNGDHFFGEERVATLLRREADVEPGVLCKMLVDAAVDFVEGPVADDMTILAVRRA
jgi:hypothetical protein